MAASNTFMNGSVFVIVAEAYDTSYDVCVILCTQQEWVAEKHFLNIENVPNILRQWTLVEHVSVVCELLSSKSATTLMHLVRMQRLDNITFDGLAYSNIDPSYFRATWASYLHSGCELATTNAAIMFVEFLSPTNRLLIAPQVKETIYIAISADSAYQRTIAVGTMDYGVRSSCYITTHSDVVNILSPWLNKKGLYDFVIVSDFIDTSLFSAIDVFLQYAGCTIVGIPWRIAINDKTKLRNFERYYHIMKKGYRCLLAHMLLEEFFINERLINAIKC